MELNYTEIGLRIRSRRKQLNLTQKELGEIVGLSEGSVSRYESGSLKDIPMQNLNDFAKALNVEIAWLVGFKSETKKYQAVHECMERIQKLDDDKCFELIESINKIIDLIKG